MDFALAGRDRLDTPGEGREGTTDRMEPLVTSISNGMPFHETAMFILPVTNLLSCGMHFGRYR